MTDFFAGRLEGGSWPDEAEEKYDRIEILGKGSFGMVWMAKRTVKSEDEYDDEFVAVKNINIKDEKGKVYAEREISILHEMHHPNVIRLIRAYPVHGQSRVVVMQLARGPNLHQLVMKRGALGLPLARLVSRHLIAAVSYLHGRAVIHRDIKPSNCIVACTQVSVLDNYYWDTDHAIWSNGQDCEDAVAQGRWKLMLVDFGFARALETEEIMAQTRHLRNSIVLEKDTKPPLVTTDLRFSLKAEKSAESSGRGLTNGVPTEDGSETSADLDRIVERAALNMRGTSFEGTNAMEKAIMGQESTMRKRQSGVSMSLPDSSPSPSTSQSRNTQLRRASTARQQVRSMSALGTKAFAAPEIRRKLRQKTDEDIVKANGAMTECVADYGMIVDAYSVGWTLRVMITGVPPSFTISEYMQERDIISVDADSDEEIITRCCCISQRQTMPCIRVRDPSSIPQEATLLIASMTEKNPEDRISVREAQHHPWIAGVGDDDSYSLPQGDVPSRHGDPVVPLNCAKELSDLTVHYHMR